MPNKTPKHVVDYFRRGQLLFLIDGEWEPALAEPLINWAKPVTDEKRVTITNFRSVKFPTVDDLIGQTEQTEEPPLPVETGGPVFSLDKSEGKKAYSSPIVVEKGGFTLVSADVPELADILAPGDPGQADKLSQNASSLLNLVRSLDQIRSTFPVGKLQVVSPNWLASGSRDSQPGTTGGPGGWPKPADGPANIKFEEYKFNLPDAIRQKIENSNMGEGVVVAILDTAPKKDATLPETWEIHRVNDPNSVLAKIYEKWVTQRSDPHPLIQDLLDPDNPRLTVYLHRDVDKPNENIEPEKYIQADGHDYEMTDHGLFVAGIIHSLAPQAELHLFQVLNRYGVGDLLTFAEALNAVVTKFPGKRVVVNASLIVGPPEEKQHTKNYNDDNDQDDDQDDIGGSILNSKKEKGEDPWFGRQDLVAKRICEFVYQLRSRVIAAAGNNHNKNRQTNRPQACYPAALEGVLGVGALPKRKIAPATGIFKATSYSNLSDRPQGTGITTLGGEEGKGKGILGIYVESFPPMNNPPPNNNGWAWWAGTSFATPIISGIIAGLLSNLPDGSKAEDAIVELFQAQSFETEQFEDVLFVTQGSP